MLIEKDCKRLKIKNVHNYGFLVARVREKYQTILPYKLYPFCSCCQSLAISVLTRPYPSQFLPSCSIGLEQKQNHSITLKQNGAQLVPTLLFDMLKLFQTVDFWQKLLEALSKTSRYRCSYVQ